MYGVTFNNPRKSTWQMCYAYVKKLDKYEAFRHNTDFRQFFLINYNPIIWWNILTGKIYFEPLWF